MKIIDLLNKIVNGEEVPKVIEYGMNIYQWTGLNYYNNKNDEYLDSCICIENLEQYIEIIEEEKKIPEKLDFVEISKNIEHKVKNDMYVSAKVNEIIDYLKSKGDE